MPNNCVYEMNIFGYNRPKTIHRRKHDPVTKVQNLLLFQHYLEGTMALTAFLTCLLVIIITTIGQDIKLWTDYSNVCGNAVTSPKKSNEYVTYLGDLNSYNDCQQECISKSNTNNQCESFIYFSNNSNDTSNKLACYARFGDPLWLPCIDNGVISGEVYWPCRNNIDCSLNGKCLSNGTCSCRAAWKGSRCQLMNFLPAPTDGGYKGYATSSWGG